MAKQQMFALAVFLLPLLVCAAREAPNKGFVVEGRVFCDTCRLGYETPLSTYVADAKVRVECVSKATQAKTCSFEGVTDKTGTYNILVKDEHEHETCEVVLVSGLHQSASSMVLGRDRAPVFLTRNNGIASDKRFANALGFQKDDIDAPPSAKCDALLKFYHQYDV